MSEPPLSTGALPRPLRVCYFGTYRAEYSRNRILIDGLRRNQVVVIECHAQLWRGIEDRVASVDGGWKNPRFWWRVVNAYLQLLRTFWPLRHEFDVMVVGYPGQFDVFLARLLCWLLRKPLVWDIFMSIYLIAVERGLDERNPAVVGLLRRIEWLACRLPDRLILDTDAYVAWFSRTHGASASCFRLAPTGADDRVFRPLPPRSLDARPLCAVYYGTFIPNHDVLTIVEAAHLLDNNAAIEFVLIGDGPERASAMQRAQTLGVHNVRFVPWLTQHELLEYVANADICLGAFGDTPQSMMTVQNKIYEGLAMRRAVITGDSPAVRSALRYGEEILLCDRRNPAALAQAIRMLAADAELRAHIAEQGHARFKATYSPAKLGESLRTYLHEVVKAGSVRQRNASSATPAVGHAEPPA